MKYDNLVIERKGHEVTTYCRTISLKRTILSIKLKELYGINNNALIFPSGLTAIMSLATTILDNLDEETVFVVGDELYCDTYDGFQYLAYKRNGLTIEFVNVSDFIGIKKLFIKYGRKISMFYIESCSNPSGQLFDYEKINNLKEYSLSTIFCTDNTWLTAYSFNPFDYGFDVVVESMTKYISGSHCIGGMVIGTHPIMENLSYYVDTYGLYVGADHCQIFIDGLYSLKERVQKTSDNMILFLEYLQTEDIIDCIKYPFIRSDKSYKLAKKYLKYYPGVVYFHILTKKLVSEFTDFMFSSEFKTIQFETSYGKSYSKIDTDIVSTSNGFWVRFSIGYDFDQNTLSEFDQILEFC